MTKSQLSLKHSHTGTRHGYDYIANIDDIYVIENTEGHKFCLRI